MYRGKYEGRIVDTQIQDGKEYQHLSLYRDGELVKLRFPDQDPKAVEVFVNFIKEVLKYHDNVEFWLDYVYCPDIIMPLIDLIVEYGERIRVMRLVDAIAAYDHHCNLKACHLSPMNLFLNGFLGSKCTLSKYEVTEVKKYASLLVKWQKQKCQLKLAGAI